MSNYIIRNDKIVGKQIVHNKTASEVSYDSATSGLNAATVQSAIDETIAKKQDVLSAEQLTAINSEVTKSKVEQIQTNRVDIAELKVNMNSALADIDLKANADDVYSKLDADTKFIKTTEKGINNGVATLDASGKIPQEQLNLSAEKLKGMWDASTNTPTLQNSVGELGDTYICSVAGSVDFGAGTVSFNEGDKVIYINSIWNRNVTPNAVASVNNKTGNVTIVAEDIFTEEQLLKLENSITSSDIAEMSANVQANTANIANVQTTVAGLDTTVTNVQAEVDVLENSKQDALSVEQIDATNSGITAAKLTNIETAISEASTQITTNTSAIETKLDKTTDVSNAGKSLVVDDAGNIVFEEATVDEIVHTSLSGNLADISTVLDLVNALIVEHRTVNKPVRFETGNISNAVLADLPQTYGYLTIKVGGYDVVEISFASSNYGFKTMYYGYPVRLKNDEFFSSLTWKAVITDSHYRVVVQGTAGYAKIKAPTKDDQLKITVTDNYGGSIEITGMTTTNAQYKPFKAVRTSNGNWNSDDAGNAVNNKLQKVYYYDNYLYVLLATYTTAIITGITEIPTVVDTLENTDTEIPIVSLLGYSLDADLTLQKGRKVVTSLGKSTYGRGQQILQDTDFTVTDKQASFEIITKNQSDATNGKHQIAQMYQITPIEGGTNASLSYIVYEDGRAQLTMYPNTTNMPRNDLNVVCEGYLNSRLNNLIYNSENELNRAKGTSITAVAGEDNTQKIADALSVGEQFIAFYHNDASRNRFGIDVSFGDLIHELRIVKCLDADLSSTYAIATAFMNTGCVLSRIFYKTYSTAWSSTKDYIESLP